MVIAGLRANGWLLKKYCLHFLEWACITFIFKKSESCQLRHSRKVSTRSIFLPVLQQTVFWQRRLSSPFSQAMKRLDKIHLPSWHLVFSEDWFEITLASDFNKAPSLPPGLEANADYIRPEARISRLKVRGTSRARPVAAWRTCQPVSLNIPFPSC